MYLSLITPAHFEQKGEKMVFKIALILKEHFREKINSYMPNKPDDVIFDFFPYKMCIRDRDYVAPVIRMNHIDKFVVKFIFNFLSGISENPQKTVADINKRKTR